jgi:hypothetical protein
MFGRQARLTAPVVALLLIGGCSSPSNPTPNPTPTPIPTPTPMPLPTPTPVPTPSPDGCAPGGDCQGRRTPVARTILRIYRVFDNRNELFNPTPEPVKQVLAQPIPVGFTILFDVTGRDADNFETNGIHGENAQIEYFVSDEHHAVHWGTLSFWQRKYLVTQPGKWKIFAVFDGVGSNDIEFTFVDCKPSEPYGCRS